MADQLTKEQVQALLLHFDNNIVVSDDDNELTLYKTLDWGRANTFLIQFNGKFLKDAKTIETAVKHFNSFIEKYKLSTELLLSEYAHETKSKNP
ncbi:ABC-type uncharacterized transport system auxiliary subunit [Chryseobacterium rhizosphaerae]|uniref:hypothetical protein n=1 Tax=Chryseobacterium rhizosphaerae TaxID=395937 RepID=UPI0028541C10|nr:hypothetical protein [Chryseobacterium rhizosphaerae]MDR6548492.1 ABC-type uncharacterized transport system auxiliary subunit [Chryseobacterium rhizosphaerae]